MDSIVNEVIKIIQRPETQALATSMSLTGYTLKDLNIKNCYSKMKEIFEDTFVEEIVDEEKKDIFFNSLVELEDYVKNTNDLDSKLFEQLLKATVNGVKISEELTKEYLKIMKEMTYIALKIFTIMFKEKTYMQNIKDDDYLTIAGLKSPYTVIKNYKSELNEIPKELIEQSLDELIKGRLLKEKIMGKQIKNGIELDFLTELGNKIMILLK